MFFPEGGVRVFLYGEPVIRHSTQHTLPGHHENLILLEQNIDTIVQVLAC